MGEAVNAMPPREVLQLTSALRHAGLAVEHIIDAAVAVPGDTVPDELLAAFAQLDRFITETKGKVAA